MDFNPQTDIPDLTGKVVLVTGGKKAFSKIQCAKQLIRLSGNAGLGAATIELLIPHKPTTILLCARTLSTADNLVSSLKPTWPETKIEVIPLDLTSLESVKECAAAVIERTDHLDWVFLNAGISTLKPGLTAEGYERQFGINHVGHALLTQLLMPKLLHSASQGHDVRVLAISSDAVRDAAPRGGLVLDEMKNPRGDMPKAPYTRYAHSKLANALFARKLAQLYPQLTCVSYHPGQVKTGILGKVDGINKVVMVALAYPMMWWKGVSPHKGAYTGLWVATSKDIRNGSHYYPVGILRDDIQYVSDQGLCDELWKWTDDELKLHGAPGWP